MAVIARIRTQLSGFIGAPGVSTMYFLDPIGAQAAVKQFWTDIVYQMPDVLVATVDITGDYFEATTGDITGTWNQGVSAALSGTDPSSYSAPSGATVRWNTAGIVNSRRVRGRTFLVPLAGSQYQPDGTISSFALPLLQAPAASLVNAIPGNMVVWSRPFAGRAATASLPAIPARLGSHHVVTGSSVRDVVAVLRSRRD